ncbi:hypothetical protein KCG48_12525 [Proteiniclasticum sp. BAD-10]|uniref:Uncharacterized protein n=1 Tax=Proteiniclasticum sediminis TaxID=2804028 RepID=A0A941CQY2_9CLOT|nr:hypothetical protein [Proteiniclasticum sediminis]MBR0577140.1 hypothetical protein [Proteiniclasticum sediminis]
MKKGLTHILIFTLALLTFGCTQKNEKEKLAEKFLQTYYSQYEAKDELITMMSSPNFSNDDLQDYLDEHYGDLITIELRDQWISNRGFPNPKILNSSIVKATLSSITFKVAEGEGSGALTFQALVKMENSGGEKSEQEVGGVVRIVKNDGDYFVEYFRLD